MEYSARQITCLAIKHTLLNSKIGKHTILLSDHSGIKTEVSNRKTTATSQHTWALSSTLLNNTWVKEESSREVLKYFELSEHKNATYKYLEAMDKAVLRGKI